MAVNPYVNKVQLADGSTLIDLTEDDVTPSEVISGRSFHLATGQRTVGTYDPTSIIDDNAGAGETSKTWSANKIVDELAPKYVKPVTGIPASDIADGVIPDISGKADKADTVLTTTLSCGRKEDTRVGPGSFAFGYRTEASGMYSHAVGNNTKATGQNCHTEGYGTTASASNAHAEGHSTTASGTESHVEGRNTIANHRSQHVFGEYNREDPSSVAAGGKGNYVEIVGNGSSGLRSNARALDWSGNEYLQGDLYVGCNSDSTNGSKVIAAPTSGSEGQLLSLDNGLNPVWISPATSVESDNTRPITSGAVYTEVGNINALLATI